MSAHRDVGGSRSETHHAASGCKGRPQPRWASSTGCWRTEDLAEIDFREYVDDLCRRLVRSYAAEATGTSFAITFPIQRKGA